MTGPTKAEAVIDVFDYCDQPRIGIALYQGEPHFFACEFDEVEDDYSDEYWVHPGSTEKLNQIWEQENDIVKFRAAVEESLKARGKKVMASFTQKEAAGEVHDPQRWQVIWDS